MIQISDQIVVDLVAAVADIKATSKSTEKSVDSLHDRLFGNGQPGEIALLKERVFELERQDIKTQTTMKNVKMFVGSALGAIGGVVTLVEGYLRIKK